MSLSLVKVIDSFHLKSIVNQRIEVLVPLSHKDKNGEKIRLVANITQKYDPAIHDTTELKSKVILPPNPKIICYIQGGPGFPCPVPLGYNGKDKVLLEKGYQILYMDQRGTGLSTPIDNNYFKHKFSKHPKETDSEYLDRKLKFILNFRADSIVEDLEILREILIGKDTKWSLLGQSFGGFCAFTYLSFHPEALREVLVTGGVPPIGLHPDDVYEATYKRTKERNVHYYDKYPQDIEKVKQISYYLSREHVTLPSGGTLSVERFQQLGLNFGATGGTDAIHQIVMKFHYELLTIGYPTLDTLNTVQNSLSFDTNVFYALFQEAIYCLEPGTVSNWSADRLRYKEVNNNFNYLVVSQSTDPLYFTGEMVYKSNFSDYSELRSFHDLADALHANSNWSKLYDLDKLNKISFSQVPVVAATYFYDQYVDFGLTMAVKDRAFKGNGNLRQYITSDYFHNGVRANPEVVLNRLFDLLDCEVD